MNQKLTHQLHNSYPEIFPKNEGGYALGFACAEGWYELIDSLCDEIMQFCKRFGKVPPIASQVKEKYGSLRFYIWSASEEVFDIIDKYELRSQFTCEICGKAGKIRRTGGWYSCECEEHYAERLERRNWTYESS